MSLRSGRTMASGAVGGAGWKGRTGAGATESCLEDRMIAETVCSAVSAAGLGIAAVTATASVSSRPPDRRLFAGARRPGDDRSRRVGWPTPPSARPAWAGFGVLGGAWLLFTTTRAVERAAAARRKERRAAGPAAQREAVAPAASAPSLGQGRAPGARPAGRQAARPPAAAADDFSDIEAILKKHGI